MGRAVLAELPTLDELLERCAEARLPGEGSLPPELRLFQEADLAIYFAPFDHVNIAARIAIIGITSGLQQAANAIAAFQQALRAGAARDHALERAKSHASFSGPMRNNLVAMLDYFRVHNLLTLSSCAALFEEVSRLAHFTSMLRHPEFWRCNNYNGTPNPMKHPVLRAYLEARLLPELDAVHNALLVPLGEKVGRLLRHFAQADRLSAERILDGLEHPSGANFERIQYLLKKKPRENLSAQTDPVRLDAARERLEARIAALLRR